MGQWGATVIEEQRRTLNLLVTRDKVAGAFGADVTDVHIASGAVRLKRLWAAKNTSAFHAGTEAVVDYDPKMS